MPVASPACAHHWLIDTPDGPTSSGRCKRCGEKREFVNEADRPRRVGRAEWGQVAVYKRRERYLNTLALQHEAVVVGKEGL